MSDLYADLGVDRQASTEDIQQAYRVRAKQAHPDAGGDPEAFRTLTTARDVLCDPVRRQAYDDTGFIPGQQPIEVEAMAAILRIAAAIHKERPHAAYPQAIREMLRSSIDAANGQVRTLELTINDIRAAWKGAEDVRDRVVAGFESTRVELRDRVGIYEKALEMMAGAMWERRRW